MRYSFFCIDGHTAGNPVRLIAGGAPVLRGNSMAERRLDFLQRYDWIRTSLCFEPRGHDMMSGGFLYPPTQPDSDVGILFIETSGCLPMCGHGTIGMVTFGLEHGLIQPRNPGKLVVDVPAGRLHIDYMMHGNRVTSVRIRNVASFVVATDIEIDIPSLGRLKVDVSYGGNFYAIVEPQAAYTGLDDLGSARILQLSPVVREAVRAKITPVHPDDANICGVSHVLWADKPKSADADGRNAVFYGNKAIDRSPCGTGTSARLAHLVAKSILTVGDSFTHESYICSKFIGRVEAVTTVGSYPAIIPSIEGSAVVTGHNTIFVDQESDSFWAGFSVT
jgi:4-hydroxyproline epimerase